MLIVKIGTVDRATVNLALLVVQSLAAARGDLTAINRSMDMAARNRPDNIPHEEIMKTWNLERKKQSHVRCLHENGFRISTSPVRHVFGIK
jgi:hypothetical protein